MSFEFGEQTIALEVHDHVREQALGLWGQAIVKVNDTEYALHSGAVEGADRTDILALHNIAQDRLNKLTSYCIQNGLLGDELLA